MNLKPKEKLEVQSDAEGICIGKYLKRKVFIILMMIVMLLILSACSSPVPKSLIDKHVKRYEVETGFQMRAGKISDFTYPSGKKTKTVYIEYYNRNGNWYEYSFITFDWKDGKWVLSKP